jgi:hypothetical protein
MIMVETDDKKVLDFFLDDSTWKKMPVKKIEKKHKIEKPEIDQPTEITENKEPDASKILTKEDTDKDKDRDEEKFGEVDYAILKSVTLGFKTIKEISGVLQIRTMVIEKHIYRLIKDGLIKYFEYCVITSKGKQAIEDFTKNNPEDVWQPIDEFIASVIETKKERNLKFQKMIDRIFLILIIVLILLIIYFGIFA